MNAFRRKVYFTFRFSGIGFAAHPNAPAGCPRKTGTRQ